MSLSAAQDVERWRATMHPRLDGLRDLFPHLRFGFTEDDLAHLERAVLDSFPDGTAVRGDAEEPHGLAWRVAGYLGETLMRAGGGAWAWEDGEPIVEFDPALGEARVSPLRIVVAAADSRSGRELAGHLRSVRAAADRLRARSPNWTPQWDDTLGLTDRLAPAVDDYLVGWLADRAATFDDWVVRYGAAHGPWDFSPESLDRIGELTLARLTSWDDFGRPEHTDFVAGASWYVGEVIRRVSSGTAEWNYIPKPSEGDRHNLWMGRPFVQQTAAPGIPVAPDALLGRVVQEKQVEYPRSLLEIFEV